MRQRSNLRLILLAGLVVFGFGSAHADSPLDPLNYTIHTTFQKPDASRIETDSSAVQNVPVLIDVNQDSLPDLVAQVTIDAGRATLRTTSLPDAPSPMPLSVIATLPDPRRALPLPLLGTPDDNLRVAFGYDALAANTAPQTYDATLAIAGAQRITSFTMDLHTVLAGDTLGVLAEVYTKGSAGEHIDPIKGRIDYTPVPAVSHFGVVSGSDIGPGIGAGQASIDLQSDTPTKGVVVIQDIQGTHENREDATVDKIPNTMSLVLTDIGSTGQQTWTYTASERVQLITIEAKELQNNVVLQDSLLEIHDMSLGATLVQDSPTHATFNSESPIGIVKVGLAKSGAPRFLEDDQYLYSYKDASVDSLAFQVKELSAAEVGSGDPFVIGATLKSGPFHVLQVNGAATTDAWLRNVPHTVKVSGSTAAGTISYEGSAPMGELTLDAHDPAGLCGRATDMHLLLRGIPTKVDLVFGGTSNSVGLDANGNQIDLLELQLTSGPDDRIDEQYDGILLEDLADRYVVFTRITALKKVSATSSPDLGLQLDTAAGRIFKVDFNQLNSQGHETNLHATLDHLVPSISVHFNPVTGTISYAGSAVMDHITLDAFDPDGLSGRATTAHLILESVPTGLDLSFGQGGSSASIDAKGSTLGLFQVQLTSGPDDQLPADKDGILVEDLTSKYVVFARITGLRKVVVDQGPPPSLTLDTTAGRVFVVDLQQQKPNGLATTQATINALVPHLSFQFASATTVNYSASDPVGSVTIDAVDPDGIAGRAKELHLTLQSLPHAFDVGFATDGTVSLDAHGERLGLIEFQLTSGPDDRIEADKDGLMLEDLADRYVVFARITGLYSASAKAPNMSLDSDAGRVFKIDTEQLLTNPAGKVQYLRATLDHLVRHISISLVDSGAKSTTIYNADSTTNSLVMDSNAGSRWNIHTSIAPLPAHLDFCGASDGSCTGASAANRPFSPNAGSQAIHASEQTVINIFDCVLPANATCSPSTATKYTKVDNFHVRTFEFDAGSNGSQSDGYIFENTTRHSGTGCAAAAQSSDTGACHDRASGTITNRDTGAGSGFQQSMGANFWADNRQGGWQLFIIARPKTGFINCDSTSLSVWVFNIQIGVSNFIC